MDHPYRLGQASPINVNLNSLGSAGFLAAPVAGYIVQHYGFTWHYIFIAAICLLTLVPISLIRETSAGQEGSATAQEA